MAASSHKVKALNIDTASSKPLTSLLSSEEKPLVNRKSLSANILHLSSTITAAVLGCLDWQHLSDRPSSTAENGPCRHILSSAEFSFLKPSFVIYIQILQTVSKTTAFITETLHRVMFLFIVFHSTRTALSSKSQ